MSQPFTTQDLHLHRKATEIDGAPDGRSVACTVRSVDRDQDDYVSCIWSLPVQGGTPRQLTRGPGLDKSPHWSPDGR
jgi:Tol biopolymer transport system component